MTLEDRLERLAARTPPADPGDVLNAARARAESRPASRSPRLLIAAAVLAVVALAAGGFALTGGDDSDSVTVAGPQGERALDGQWTMTASVTDGEIRVTRGKASVTVDGDTVVGDDGCSNGMRAALVDGRAVWNESREDVGCEDEQANDDANRFWRVIEQQPRVETRDRELWLVADDGDALVFHRPDAGQVDQAGGVDGPVLSGPERSMIHQAKVEGRLSLRGDCLYLHGEGGEAEWPLLPAVWPNGTTWQDSPQGVRLPGGTVVPVGAWVTASGTYEDVDGLAERGHATAVADRAQACDVEGNGVVAYVRGEVAVSNADGAVEGDSAVWDVDPARLPAPSATSVTALVTRLGCSGGETGKVLAPLVSADAEEVVVTFSVEPLPGDEYPCPGNRAVPYVVELDERLGDRELVDGACLSGEAASTSFCSEGAVRWPPPT